MAIVSRSFLNRIRLERELGAGRKSARVILKEGATVPLDHRFDVFLSHSYDDVRRVGTDDLVRLKLLLESAGHSVYVDWITDYELDRGYVTHATAERLRVRMDHCRSLLYAVSDNAAVSRWMPWELGYFDGRKGRVAVLPIDENDEKPDRFYGMEYLGLYPYVTVDSEQPGTADFVVEEPDGSSCSFDDWIDGENPH